MADEVEMEMGGGSRTLTLFMGEIDGSCSKDSFARRLIGLTGCVADADAAAGNTEYRSIWPIGAAVAVIEIFSEPESASASAFASGVSTPQFTGFRLISLPCPSFAVAGTKKLFSVCLFEAEALALLLSARWRKLGDFVYGSGPSSASR